MDGGKPVNDKRLAWTQCCVKIRLLPLHCSTRIGPAYATAGAVFDAFWDSGMDDAEQCILQGVAYFKKSVAEQKAERDRNANAA